MSRDPAQRFAAAEKECPTDGCYHVWTLGVSRSSRPTAAYYADRRCYAARATAKWYAARKPSHTRVLKCPPGCPCAAWPTFAPDPGEPAALR